MISFTQFCSERNELSLIIETWLESVNTLSEANDTIVYSKDKQNIFISNHGEERLLVRKWWTDWNDPDFTSFADKSLLALSNNFKNAKLDKNLNKMVNNEIIFQSYFEVAFVSRNIDKSSPHVYNRGIIGSLRESKDNSITSYNIMTILNIEKMDQSRPLLSRATKTIEIFGYKTNSEKEQYSKNIEVKITSLQNELDELQLQIWDLEPTGNIKELKKVKNVFDNKTAELNNLQKELTNLVESVIIKNNERMLVILPI